MWHGKEHSENEPGKRACVVSDTVKRIRSDSWRSAFPHALTSDGMILPCLPTHASVIFLGLLAL